MNKFEPAVNTKLLAGVAMLLGAAFSGGGGAYGYTWNNVAAGSYNLTARATDNRGAITPSTAITVISNALPTVSITSPTNNMIFNPGTNLPIMITAADADGTISQVQIYQGATLLGAAFSGGGGTYGYTWNNVAAGSYNLTARATDNRGATTTSTAITVTSNTPPTVNIQSPANNSTFTGGSNLPIYVAANDTNGTISRVDIYQGTTFLGQAVAGLSHIFVWNNVPAGTYVLTAKATDNLGAITTSTGINITSNATPTPTPTPSTTLMNLALAANGATASASSVLALGYPASATNNGDRKGANFGSGGGWTDASYGSFPDWLQIDFSGSKTINEIDVFTLQNDFPNASEPTETMIFTSYGVTAYDVQYWNGTAWVTVPGGNITGNNKVWRKFIFAAITTSKIRILTNDAADHGYSRITEIEAYTPSLSFNAVPFAVEGSNLTALNSTPDSRLFVCQQNGQSRDGALLPMLFDGSAVNPTGERRPPGEALGSDGVSNQFICVNYTRMTSVHHRVSRFTANEFWHWLSTS